MPHTEQDTEPVRIIDADLGDGNLGYFGPSSETEAAAANDYGNEKYLGPSESESVCMDDRNRQPGLHLPGNRSITEIAGEYMAEGSEHLSLSRATAKKVKELVDLGHTPWYHGDEGAGKAGCAANASVRAVLAYNADHPNVVIPRVYTRMRLLGRDQVSQDMIKQSIDIGGDRAARDEVWDAQAAEIVEIAEANGAHYHVLKGAHRTAGSREQMREGTFLNDRFLDDHNTDDGHPMGALAVDYGEYAQQLTEDGFAPEEIDKKLMHAAIYSVGLFKLALKEDAVGKIIV